MSYIAGVNSSPVPTTQRRQRKGKHRHAVTYRHTHRNTNRHRHTQKHLQTHTYTQIRRTINSFQNHFIKLKIISKISNNEWHRKTSSYNRKTLVCLVTYTPRILLLHNTWLFHPISISRSGMSRGLDRTRHERHGTYNRQSCALISDCFPQ